MKVIINKCYGGFGFSAAFIIHLYEEAPEVFTTVDPKKYFGSKKKFENILDNGKGFDKVIADNKNYSLIGSESLSYIQGFYNKKDKQFYHIHGSSSLRDNKRVIELLEKFGFKKANGRFADLKIVEVPDGVIYTIKEYDGIEHVAQIHQTWE